MILHISDLHFESLSSISLIDKMLDSLDEHNLTIKYLVMSGDFLYKGTCPDFSDEAIKKIITRLKLDRNRIITCPGNHDLDVKKNKLNSEYLNLMMSIYNNETELFLNNGESSKVFDFPADNICFVTVNSCFHLDHEFGKVDLDLLMKELESIDPDRRKILVIHHHMIPYNQYDKSQICNGYEFLKLVDFHDVEMILHGHRHCELDISIGKARVFGVGSFLFPNSTNLNNQFNVYEEIGIAKKFRYLSDMLSPKDGRLGYWKCN